MDLDDFFPPFFICTEEKAKPKGQFPQKPRILPEQRTPNSTSQQLSVEEQWIFLRGELIKKCTLEAWLAQSSL